MIPLKAYSFGCKHVGIAYKASTGSSTASIYGVAPEGHYSGAWLYIESYGPSTYARRLLALETAKPYFARKLEWPAANGELTPLVAFPPTSPKRRK